MSKQTMSNGRAFGSFAPAKSKQGTRHGDLWKVSQGWENGLTIDDALRQMTAKRKNIKPVVEPATDRLLERIANLEKELKTQAKVILLLTCDPPRTWLSIEEVIARGVGLSPQAIRYWCRHYGIGELVKGRWRISLAKMRAVWIDRYGEEHMPTGLRD
jgi:hypothetical protein